MVKITRFTNISPYVFTLAVLHCWRISGMGCNACRRAMRGIAPIECTANGKNRGINQILFVQILCLHPIQSRFLALCQHDFRCHCSHQSNQSHRGLPFGNIPDSHEAKGWWIVCLKNTRLEGMSSFMVIYMHKRGILAVSLNTFA